MKNRNILKPLVTGILTLFIFTGFIFTSCQPPPNADEWSDSPKWRDKKAVIRLWSEDMKDANKERVMIKAGDITMGATLYRPQNVLGDLQGIVIVHGSGRVDRRVARFYTFRAFQMALRFSFSTNEVSENPPENIFHLLLKPVKRHLTT